MTAPTEPGAPDAQALPPPEGGGTPIQYPTMPSAPTMTLERPTETVPAYALTGDQASAQNGAAATAPAALDGAMVQNRPPERPSYQFRALSRKTLSYQKRQTCANVCCVALCPLLMVLLCWVLGFVIQLVIDRQMVLNNVVYCSNATSVDSFNFPLVASDVDGGIPFKSLSSVPRSSVPYARYDPVYLANYLVIPLVISLGTTTSAMPLNLLGNAGPCVTYFGPDYVFNASVYTRDPQLQNESMGFSTMPWTMPLYGWLNGTSFVNPAYYGTTGAPIDIFGNIIRTNATDPVSAYSALSQAFLAFASFQSLPWFYTYQTSMVSPSAVGERPETLPFDSFAGMSPVPYTNATAGSGVMESLPFQYYINLTVSAGGVVLLGPTPEPVLTQTPYSVAVNGISDANMLTSMDTQISNLLRGMYNSLSAINVDNASDSGVSSAATLSLLAQSANIVADLPYGAIMFQDMDYALNQFQYTWQIGSDRRVTKSSSFPSEGYRRLYTESMLSNSIMRSMGAKKGNSTMAGSRITQGVRALPSLQSNRIVINVGSYVGVVLYPYGVSFLLPIFVLTLVREKEQRILVMMRMSGLRPGVYYLTHFLHLFVLYVLSCVVFLISGAIARLSLFSQTAAGVLIIVFLMWGFVQIALSFVMATLFNRARSALVTSFLVVLASVVINTAAAGLYTGGYAPSPAYLIWPPFAFYRTLTVLNRATYAVGEVPYTISRIQPGDEVFTGIMFMLWQIFVLAALAFYLNAVMPSEYGVPKKWNFIFVEPWNSAKAWWGRRKHRSVTSSSSGPDSDGVVVPVSNSAAHAPVSPTDAEDLGRSVNPEVLALEDEDVAEERQRVLSGVCDGESPLIIKRAQKSYNANKMAVKDVSFAVESGMVFGLLGPNGAGKSTLISILTGLYQPTHGDLWLAGYSVRTEIDQVYKHIGVCPQHDIVWDDLTVEEHLLFYARIKGIEKKREMEIVNRSITAVALAPFRHRLAKALSGGTKRRLSIAIALVAEPAVVFLDEPTTGLDPEVRRLIWNIISDERKGKTIVLTTHSMEEADVLCQRIAIMAKGTLRCIGPQARLKQLYGDGFKLSCAASAENLPRASKLVESLLPSSATLVERFITSVSYEFKPSSGLLSSLINDLQAHKEYYGIESWSLSETTLEEVFLKLISETDAEADLDRHGGSGRGVMSTVCQATSNFSTRVRQTFSKKGHDAAVPAYATHSADSGDSAP